MHEIYAANIYQTCHNFCISSPNEVKTILSGFLFIEQIIGKKKYFPFIFRESRGENYDKKV